MKKKFAIAAVAAMAVTVGAPVATAGAAYGPCYTQQSLFEKYNIQTDMDAPAVAYAYNTVCSVTG
jgi:hypothetical protein